MKTNKLIICTIAILLIFSLLSCEASSYLAFGLVKVAKDDYCMTSFERLEGKLVLSLRYTKKSEGHIHYSATLEEGEINVYYESVAISKEMLFNIKAGETLDTFGGYIEKGQQKIIIETVSPAKGKITIEFE